MIKHSIGESVHARFDTITLDDPAATSESGYSGAPFVATEAIIEYRRVHDAGPWAVYRVKLTGRRLRQDGRPGLAPAERTYRGGGHGLVLPAWLGEIVDAVEAP